MPRRSILLAAERQSLLAISDLKDDLIQHYTLSDIDLALIQQCRGTHNRLGFAIQLCYMRHPGLVLASDSAPFPPLLQWVADQLKIPVDAWHLYAQRAETRREHLLVLQSTFGFVPFKTQLHHAVAVQQLQALAAQTDKGIVLATALVDLLRRQHILLPTLDVLERICAEAITVANRQVYTILTHGLSQYHLTQLDGLLVLKTGTNQTWLAWLRQSPVKANSVHMNAHIDRLNVLKRISLPLGIERHTHQNRLLKIAREGGQMKAADLAKFEPQRRYATLVALVIETQATVIDEIIDLHDRIIGKLFAGMARCNTLPEAVITDSGLKITPLDAVIPSAAQQLIDQVAARLPQVKITELLLEVANGLGLAISLPILKPASLPKISRCC